MQGLRLWALREDSGQLPACKRLGGHGMPRPLLCQWGGVSVCTERCERAGASAQIRLSGQAKLTAHIGMQGRPVCTCTWGLWAHAQTGE